jgi:hypothetical protein
VIGGTQVLYTLECTENLQTNSCLEMLASSSGRQERLIVAGRNGSTEDFLACEDVCVSVFIRDPSRETLPHRTGLYYKSLLGVQSFVFSDRPEYFERLQYLIDVDVLHSGCYAGAHHNKEQPSTAGRNFHDDQVSKGKLAK